MTKFSKKSVIVNAKYLRWLRRGLDTHVSLPLFAFVLLAVIWIATLREIDADFARSKQSAAVSLRDIVGTYEAQVARSLDSIDQTLRMVKYAVEHKGAKEALPELSREGLLPPGVVFSVSVVDQYGKTVTTYPQIPSKSVADQPYFTFHQARDSGITYVSQVTRDPIDDGWHLHFTRRLNDRAGKFSGVVVVETDPGYFTSSYERSSLGEQGILGLIGDDGVVRALRTGDQLSFGQKTNSLSDVYGFGGIRRLAGARKLRGAALNMVVGLSETELNATYEHDRGTKLWQASAASIGLVCGTALLWLWSWQGARNRKRIRRAQETYAAASAASLDAFFVMREIRDSAGEIVDFAFVDVNLRAEKLTGFSMDQLKKMTLCGLMPYARDNGMLSQMVHITGAGGVHEQEWESNGPLFGTRWLRKQVVSVEGGLVAIVRDISERKLAESRLAHLAQHDTLTGLPNRSLISDRLDMTIAQAQRRGATVAVAFIDLDGFKLINDGLGHNAGDELLRVIAKRMSDCLRIGDTVGRFGGDEFVLVLSDQEDDISISAVLERVREAVLWPVTLCEQDVQVSCSVGVAVYPADGSDAETLLMHADTAMYRAKEAGKNNCQFFAIGMNVGVEEKLTMLESMRCALDENQFRLVYQPMVDLHSGHMCGIEALVRWDHPQHGRTGPDRFIPLAEESGMIIALGDWVLRTACLQNRAWQDAGLPPMRISVNVSPRQFEEAKLVERVMSALSDSGMDAEWLEIEVTEGVIMRDLPKAVEKMTALRAMGVSLSIDDFGTGYSSLSALKSFPVTTLKIDKSFIRDIGQSDGDQAIALSIISLAHRLKLRVVAEGVETEEQHSFLSENSCDEVQGYLYSHPLMPEQLSNLLSSFEYIGQRATPLQTAA